MGLGLGCHRNPRRIALPTGFTLVATFWCSSGARRVTDGGVLDRIHLRRIRLGHRQLQARDEGREREATMAAARGGGGG
jgi:hypothetical protein